MTREDQARLARLKQRVANRSPEKDISDIEEDDEFLLRLLAAATSRPSAPTDADLLSVGYAPGGYLMRCPDCGDQVMDVDKRSRCCRPCAVKRWHARPSAPSEAEVKRVRDALHNSTVLIRALTGADDVVANVTIAENDAALAAIGGAKP